MLLETFFFLCGIAVVCFIFAEFTKSKPEIGVIGALLLILISIWVYSDGIQQNVGTVTTYDMNEVHDSSVENFVNVTITGTETVSTVLEEIEVEYVEFRFLMSIVLLLGGIYLLFFYGFNV